LYKVRLFETTITTTTTTPNQKLWATTNQWFILDPFFVYDVGFVSSLCDIKREVSGHYYTWWSHQDNHVNITFEIDFRRSKDPAMTTSPLPAFHHFVKWKEMTDIYLKSLDALKRHWMN
jgi:hypothetical protein